MARKTASAGKPIDSLKHKDKRKNIPTEELRDFLSKEEQTPSVAEYPGLLYARDPSLDPQLVWKGKDAQDRTPLIVPSVPVYIQEKIHPQVLIEDLLSESQRAGKKSQPQIDLFADFNGLPEDFSARVDFYRHEGNWSNRMILGDSLLVMTSLAEKEGLKGQVQMIYMDPPYGIKFNSNWQVSTRKRDVKDGKVEDITRQPEQIRAFRDTWELGIHSYLSYLRDRLIVTRELLTESGSVFVQIGDENVHLVRCLMDEVFGGENFVSVISFSTTSARGAGMLDCISDYLLWYAKQKPVAKFRILFRQRLAGEITVGQYDFIETVDGIGLAKEDDYNRPERLLAHADTTSQGETESGSFSFNYKGIAYRPPRNRHWSTTSYGMERLTTANRLLPLGERLRYKRFLRDIPVVALNNAWSDTITSGFSEKKRYVVQTLPKVIERCLLMTTDPGDLVLDPTCGSGTTAIVSEQWGRRWITCDTSRVALALARKRLMSARFPYYILADSSEGLQKEAEITGKVPPQYKTDEDIKKGFVCKRVPHITLKSIANNEEIDAIHAKYQTQLDDLRKKINALLEKPLEEWELPREGDDRIAGRLKELLSQWWDIRRRRQSEIDASITKNAEQEILVDQPYEDSKRVRVTGPFTVESLSPHRVLHSEEKGHSKNSGKVTLASDFVNIVIENLKKSGVENTKKSERLHFVRLEPYAGTWLHAEGEYHDKDGQSHRAAICIGPEHGTVGPELVKEAAKEAVKGKGFDLVLVCGLAFDPHVSEEAKRYGDLIVLPVRLNADLSMGEDLLKKTGAGNLFMVFGEPDMEIKKQEDGKVIVTIKGLDIYDPTTGEIRSSTTDDIACWFIDTNYNEESFFVRQAYFCGADKPYEKLQRSLRAQINESAWQTLYSTTSRPFDPPKTGKIAIKVINHYGDEVLRVYGMS